MRKRWLIFLLCWALAPLAAQANVGVIRGGEHESFTRLVISVDEPIQSINMVSEAIPRIQIETTPNLTSLNVSLLFDRLSVGRIKKAFFQDGNVVVDLNCICTATASVLGDHLIILDVYSGVVQGDTTGQVNLQAELPTNVPVPPRPVVTPTFPEFEIDYSVVERVSKNISAQMAEQHQIAWQGRRNTDFRQRQSEQNPEVPVHLGELPEIVDDIDKPTCELEKQAWDIVQHQAGFREAEIDETSNLDDVDLMSTNEAMLKEGLRLMSLGLIHEARSSLFLANVSGGKLRQLQYLLDDMLNDDIPGHGIRQKNCSPLSEFMLMTSGDKALSGLQNSEIQALFHAFRSFPLGLQLALYPRLSPLVGEDFGALFTEFEHHRDRELSLVHMSKTTPSVSSSFEHDDVGPDELAAVAVELRDTEFAQKSWDTAFKAFLDDGRFFDALDSFDSASDFAPDKLKDATKALLDAVWTHADSLTLLHFALVEIPNMDTDLNHGSLRHIAERLRLEGFPAEAELLSTSYNLGTQIGLPDTITEQSSFIDLAPDARRVRRKPNDADTIPSAGDSTINPTTVASAKKQLEHAQSVRENLQVRLAGNGN